MVKSKFPGRVINHSSIELLVLETDSGPAIVHRLGPRMKTPDGVDADAFKRADGKTILGHKDWWKIPDWFVADIYQIGEDALIPVSVMLPVGDKQFGEYSEDNSKSWGIQLTYVECIKYDKSGKVVGYSITGRGEVTRAEAITMAEDGLLDNVVIVTNKKGNRYLRTKKNVTTLKNLT
jgi:hypothetical protein